MCIEGFRVSVNRSQALGKHLTCFFFVNSGKYYWEQKKLVITLDVGEEVQVVDMKQINTGYVFQYAKKNIISFRTAC